MANRKVVEVYYSDISNLNELLSKLVNSYRLLVGAADELNKIALSKKSEVRDALKRVDKLGSIIDNIIKSLDEASYNYTNYCKIKTEIMKYKLEAEYIETEIQQELKLKE